MPCIPGSVAIDVNHGVCFGYEIESSIDFEYLRKGTGDPLTISEHDGTWEAGKGELLVDWEARPNRPAHVKLHRAGSGFGLWVSDAGWYEIAPGANHITIPPSGNELRREERLWGMPSLLTFLNRGDLPLHAGAVDMDGAAVLFGGPTRHGKTTLAASLFDHGYRLLSEDLSCVTRSGDVIPGPTMIRLRHDMAEAMDVRSTTPVGKDEERTHLAMTGPEAEDSSIVPLSAILLLEVADDIGLTRVDPMEALPSLWQITFHLPIDDHSRWIFDRITELATTVPIFRFRRPLRLDAIPATIEAMQGIGSDVGA